jgi:hypothetical protein
MISVITCSVDSRLFEKFLKSVGDTIGVPYEIIKVDNTKHAYKSLTKAYNDGAQKARYPTLCFIHEDVIFKRNNWGALVLKYLSDETVGLLGLAGSKFKTSSVSSWMQPVVDGVSFNRYHFIQSYKFITKQSEERVSNPLNEAASDVACLDGFFLACRREVIRKYQFDETIGFHGYDFDLCMRIRNQYRLVVALDILAEHGSEGKPNEEWYSTYIRLHWHYRKQLPIKTSDCLLTIEQIRQVEKSQRLYFKKQLIKVVKQPYLLFKLLVFLSLIEARQLNLRNISNYGWINLKLWFHVLLKSQVR